MSASAALLVASPTFPSASAGTIGVATGLPDEPYTIRCVDMNGTLITELVLADPGDITETLNAPDSFDISFPKDAYERADIDVIGRFDGPMEVQILLGTQILAWGPAIASGGGSNAGPVKLTCAGVDWYWAKRNIDTPPVNLLPNANFEEGLTGWTVQDGATLAEVITDPVVDGGQAIRLTQFAGSGTGIISDAFNITTGRNWEVLTITFSFILELFGTPPLFDGGMLVEAGPPGGGGTVSGGVNAQATALYNIDATTPVGVEVRPSLQIKIPPHTTWAVAVNLFGPATGIIVWDAGYVVAEKTLSTLGLTGPDAAVPIVDVSRIVRMIANHALTALNYKSDLRIALDLPTVGIKLARAYRYSDHIAFDQAIAEFWQRDDCFDYDIVYTATTRTLVIYPIATGPGPGAGQGVDRSANITLAYGIPADFGVVLVVGFVPSIDGASTVTQAAELGDGSGGAREERWATDTSLVGGVILQGVFNAPVNVPLNSLTPQARAIVTQRGAPPKVLEVTIDNVPVVLIEGHDPVNLQEHLQKGDIVNVEFHDGYWVFRGTWRIVRRVRHCRARMMTLTLNRIITDAGGSGTGSGGDAAPLFTATSPPDGEVGVVY